MSFLIQCDHFDLISMLALKFKIKESWEQRQIFCFFELLLQLYITMGSKDKKEQDDAFNVLQEITDVLVDEEEKARLAEKAEKKRLKKEMTKEERQAQREINRKNREKKKSKKDLNKKRKVSRDAAAERLWTQCKS